MYSTGGATLKMNINDASKKLSEIDISIKTKHLEIDVLWFRVMSVEDDWEIKRHCHHSYEFHFVREGGSTVTLDDGCFEVAKNDFYITAPGVYHEQSNNVKTRYVEYCINCDIRLLSDEESEEVTLVEILKTSKCLPFSNAQNVLALFEKSLEEGYRQEFGFHSNIRSLISLMLIETTRQVIAANKLDYQKLDKYNKSDFRFLEIHQYIMSNIDKNVNVKMLAKHMNLSEKQVTRIVKNSINLTPKAMINDIRLNKAKELLRVTDLTISQISDTLGFSSPYYFSTFFNRLVGCNPSSYRDVSKS